ncbi:MAG: pyruvate dehydrogenase (acetyl-transferring) E1 component subunit alpha [Actinobacteria bacterium]|nr:MAG: pyruvate dehydrogenase (acetyl-transferring) E1 component subunit alpha [Actinomycetota bacterium]
MKGFVDPGSVSTESVQVLKPDGTLVPDHGYDIDLKEEDLREIYRVMILTRRIDQESTNLQRQGELGVYTPALGQEGAQVGAAYALEPQDWIFPSYRELGFAMLRGVQPSHILHLFRGTWHGGLFDYREYCIAPYAVPIATQTLHAVGFATGAKIDGTNTVAITCFGDGATSEGDFHEACNFAGVWKTPVVFFCQNNQYAISVPLAKQTAAPTIAVKALGYGFPGVRVDGNDVLASYVVTREAVRRARRGEGPTLIEAVTYRRGPHSTADDPSRYRTDEELNTWEALDPIARFEKYLETEGVLTAEFKEQCDAEGREAASKLRKEIVGAGPLDPNLLFEHVYAERTPNLEEQFAQFKRDQEGQ